MNVQCDPRWSRKTRRELLAFFVLTFAISWAAWSVAIVIGEEFTSSAVLPFFLIGGFGPLLAAALVRLIWKREPRVSKVKPPIARRMRWRSVAFLLGLAGPAGGALIAVLVGAPRFDSTEVDNLVGSGLGIITQIVAMVIAGPLSEEPGWRGYALPRLRLHLTATKAAVVLGPIWALWHLPLFFVNGTFQRDQGLLTGRGLLFFVGISFGTVLFNFAYEKLGGTTSAVVAHFAFNATSSLLAFSSIAPSIFSVLIQAALAAVILRRYPSDRTDRESIDRLVRDRATNDQVVARRVG
jgi:uncharacterized protein